MEQDNANKLTRGLIVMAYVVMVYVAMAYVAMAYVAMAFVVTVLHELRTFLLVL